MAAILKSAILDSANLHKINFTHSFRLNLMMTAILNSVMLGSDTAILDSDTLLSSLRFTQKHSHSTLTLTQAISVQLNLIQSHLNWWWQPSWILTSWILAILDSGHDSISSQTHSHLPRLVPTICTKKLHSFFLTQLEDGSHLEICHLGFSQFTQKTSLIHSDSTWWWQPSWILSGWIQTLPSRIQTPCYLLSDSLKNTLTLLWLWLKLIQSDSNSFILT